MLEINVIDYRMFKILLTLRKINRITVEIATVFFVFFLFITICIMANNLHKNKVKICRKKKPHAKVV